VTRKRSGRRSQRRLGTQYHSSARHVRFSLGPTTSGWRAGGFRLIGVLLLVILGWATYVIFNSPGFYISEIEVQGNASVTAAEVYAVSELEDVSIFWVNPAEIAARVETLPNVKSAQVKVRLPARITIAIQERQPELVWQTGDTRWWVDTQGTIMPYRADLGDALTIIDIESQPISSNQELDPTILEAAYSLRRLLPDLRVMHYSRATGISFQTPEGWPVHLGDGQDMDAKLTILVTLRKDLLTRGVAPEFIDIRFVESPFYK
jgi:cell division protein FtsQ